MIHHRKKTIRAKMGLSKKLKPFRRSELLSPLRYPGGKSWLIPSVDMWLDFLQSTKRNHFIEPFAGGANVGLLMLAKGKIGRLTIAEIDKRISAFWQVVLNDPDWLIDAIRRFVPTEENLLFLLQKEPEHSCDLGFQTLLRNRTSRGGVIANGAGLLKRGERNRGLFSRWYPNTLIKRVEIIKTLRTHINLVCGDGMQLLESRHACVNDIYFIDPPYSFSDDSAGKRLYTHYELEHTKLFQIARALAGQFLITHEANAAIDRIAKQYGLAIKLISMKNSHNVRRKEALISTDLSWLSMTAPRKTKGMEQISRVSI